VFAEDLTLFFADFGVTAVSGLVSAQVIFDALGMDILSGRVQSTTYEMTYRTSDFPALAYGDSVTINGVVYQVHGSNTLDDGQISKALLEIP
jgi:hypothetical protein